MNSLRDDLREKYIGLSRKADHESSRSSAIRLFCLECMGGSLADVKDCQTQACFLWPYRNNSCETVRYPGIVPEARYGDNPFAKDDEDILDEFLEGADD